LAKKLEKQWGKGALLTGKKEYFGSDQHLPVLPTEELLSRSPAGPTATTCSF